MGELNGVAIADSVAGYRMLEANLPPAYYVPPSDVLMDYFTRAELSTHCPYKGDASYYSVSVDGKSVDNVAWTYTTPLDAVAVIAGYLSFYANKGDACFVDDEKVGVLKEAFWGGWITSGIEGVGPLPKRPPVVAPPTVPASSEP